MITVTWVTDHVTSMQLHPAPAPALPPTVRSLLVSGTCNPLDIAISVGNAIIVTPTRLTHHDPAMPLTHTLETIQVVSCPTLSRTLALLAALRVDTALDPAAPFTGALPRAPALIILHHPSILSMPTLSAYAHVIVSTLDTAAFLSPDTCVVVFEKEGFKLPVTHSAASMVGVLPSLSKYFQYHAECLSEAPGMYSSSRTVHLLTDQ